MFGILGGKAPEIKLKVGKASNSLSKRVKLLPFVKPKKQSRPKLSKKRPLNMKIIARIGYLGYFCCQMTITLQQYQFHIVGLNVLKHMLGHIWCVRKVQTYVHCNLQFYHNQLVCLLSGMLDGFPAKLEFENQVQKGHL